MFCRNCGTKLEEGAKECLQCGTQVIASEVQSTQSVEVKKEKKKLPKFLIPILACIAIIIAICIIFAMQPPKYNIEKYVTINYEGYNGYGRAYANLDYNTLYKDINKKRPKSNDLNLDNLNSTLALEDAIRSISLTLVSKPDGLSNGDEIKVEITYNNELAKKAKIQFAGKNISKKVEGLEEIKKVDVFKDVEVTFSGVSPNGNINYTYNGDNSYISEYSFNLDKYQGFKNGDEVVLTLSLSNDDCIYYGFIPTEREKKYIVSGLDEYIQSYDDLTDDFLNLLKSEAEDTISAYVAKTYSKSSSLSELKLSGYNLNSVKNTENYFYTYNDFYLIYTGIVSSSDGNFRTSKVYFPVRFSNILKSNNNLTYETNGGIQGSSYLDGTYYSTKGYTNPYKCYLDLIEANRDTYVSSPGGGFEEYKNYNPILELSEIDENYKSTLVQEATDVVTSYLTKDNYSIQNLKLLGEYLLLSKNQGTDFKDNNIYYLVLSGEVSNKSGVSHTWYFPLKYGGISKLPNNEYLISYFSGISGRSSFADTWYSIRGYSDGKIMFSELVTAEREKYTYKISEELKQFGE